MLEEIYQNVITGHAEGVAAGVQLALNAQCTPVEILDQSLIPAMTEIGHRFEYGECFVPEMLIAARAMQKGLAVLKPHLVEANAKPLGKVVLGTVRGDLHDIGKNLVGMMLEGTGFEVIDLGVDVQPERFVEAVRLHRPDFVGISALLTTTMSGISTVIEALNEAGLRHQVLVMVGGAPLTQEFANQVGADLYAPDAALAAKHAGMLL
jgi:5-methyltetrahydrofolate--homocysteine methyltransferase